MKPEVSILIPTYNSEAYIAQAIESLLNQTYSNFEILLIDDASTDSTLDLVSSFNDSRIKIISNKYNRGVSYSRNCGIKAAQGEWIALLDSDDWYAPERLERLLLVAQQNNADLVADNLNLIRDCESQPWSTLLQENEQNRSKIRIIDAVEFVISDRPNPINAKRNWSFGYTKPLIKRSFLLQHGIKYDETIKVGEDYVLYLECLRQQARFVLVPESFYYYRTRITSLSTRKPTEYLADSCDITNLFINRELADQRNSALLKALFENLVIYKKRLAYYQVLAAIKQKDIAQTILLILENPYTLGDLLSKFISIIYKRFKFTIESNQRKEISFDVISVKE